MRTTLFTLIIFILIYLLVYWLWKSNNEGGKKAYTVKPGWAGFASWRPALFCKKYIAPVLLYLLAFLVIGLNARLMFDQVVWGDEAFSINTAKCSVYGIMQIMYYLDNHPPLYYFWLKLWGDLFGFSIPVCHLASLVPFGMGILLALSCFRKKFGAVPSAFFIVLSGLGTFCLEYNQEIRMYALAFFSLTACFYCAYLVIATEKRAAWIGMVLWGLAGAYSHYYALVSGGLLVFFTGAAVWLKYRGKSWIKGVCAVMAFLVGYTPWLFFLYTAIRNVSSNWWVTEILKGKDALNMILTGGANAKTVAVLLGFLCLSVLTADSGMIRRAKSGESKLSLYPPDIQRWNDKTYIVVTGLCTIIGTIAFGYFLCFVMTPVLVARYLYPVSAVTLCVLVAAAGRLLEIGKELEENESVRHLQGIGKAFLVCFCVLLFVRGIGNYRSYAGVVKEEQRGTQATMKMIGVPDKDIRMVTNGVQHLGWTVLKYYYPDNEIVNGDYNMSGSNRFWYFNPAALSPETIQALESGGLYVTDYGAQRIGKYPFYLYYMERG